MAKRERSAKDGGEKKAKRELVDGKDGKKAKQKRKLVDAKGNETKDKGKEKRGKNNGKDGKKKDDGPPREEWSKSKKKRMRKLKAKMLVDLRGGDDQKASADRTENGSSNNAKKRKIDEGEEKKGGKLSALQQSFLARLTGSRFRELNEELYTTSSTEAFSKFSSQPQLYEQYHEGFRHQVENWPVNPVTSITKWFTNKYMHGNDDGKTDGVVVADFGCGDAALAKQLLQLTTKGATKTSVHVHSFDLVASCDLVTACDMANTPLKTGSVDVAVFCLALMGTNLADFIREAHRVLKKTGILKIAEVRSRFEKGDDLKEFTDILEKLGFDLLKQDRSNKMFLLFELKKNEKNPDKKLCYTAKPCIYKRR